MRTCQVRLTGDIWWRLPTEWPGLAFPALGMHLHAPHRIRRHENDSVSVTKLRDVNEVMVVSSYLNVEVSTNDFLEAREAVTLLLDRLRFGSGQVSIPRSYSLFWWEGFDLHPELEPGNFETEGSNWNQVFASKAVTHEACEVAASATEVLPPYMFLIDAADAVLHDDFRRAIIYSAISAETVSKFGVDAAAVTAETSRTGDLSLRYLQMQPSGHWKDGVLARLRKSEKFLDLLDVVPLYLLGRSLSQDKPSVFRDATALYKTRCKLVHEADVPEAGSFLPVSNEGAHLALECAVSIFEWWGMAAKRFIVPREAFPGTTISKQT